MSGIETYGGQCPHCQKPMFQKWDSCNHALLFDACAHCGFIYGTFFKEGAGITDIEGEEAVRMWREILEHHCVSNPRELVERYGKMETGKDIDDFFPTLFDYSKDSQSEIVSRVVSFDRLNVPVGTN